MDIGDTQPVYPGFETAALPVAKVDWHAPMDARLLRHMAIVPQYQWINDSGRDGGFWIITGWGLVPVDQVASKAILLEREKGSA